MEKEAQGKVKEMREQVLRSLISGADARVSNAPNLAMQNTARQYAFELRSQFYREFGREVPSY